MASASDFFRHCPSCGKRFSIKLVDKKLESEAKERVVTEVPRGHLQSGGSFGEIVPMTVLDTAVTTIVDTKEFGYSYHCKHCGHEWTEIRKQTTVS
ncbi:MAG: hypothetical protein JRN56_02790 [Nitrososphaerota archaeon]|nr:hypothetical protein [Nitrososphaerota archaeon]MDG6970605.1 hypothetical protein [Nitrososphaerota archaeon]MDG6992912.1 hypothetical protein [Nitrososphaerota archaeon]MDG7002809.1 hypothetical protein [Nitrososphaerota archaeon]MDG7032534.1 hypothetical protein [Nitrososphaerota archaeon]